MKQKEIFLKIEGDRWFQRNQKLIETRGLDNDPVLIELLELKDTFSEDKDISVLEIGCSSGYKLEWIKKNLGYVCKGIEPSREAVCAAREKGLEVFQGTADLLPFESNSFDILIFGFCLYLCDRQDLFRIACEADRVLKNHSYLIIYDFYSPFHIKVVYHHYPGLFTHKMDYKSMFTWHPAYTCLKQKIFHHETFKYTDEQEQLVTVCTIRKYL